MTTKHNQHHHPLSFHIATHRAPLPASAIHHRRAPRLSLTPGPLAPPSRPHSFTFLANPENPGLLAVAEQSAAHHGLFVHAKEAKACALCISITAHRRLARRLRPSHLRGPPARVVITASTARNEQRAESRRRPRLTFDHLQTRSIATSHSRRGGKCWRQCSRTEPERSVCRDHNRQREQHVWE